MAEQSEETKEVRRTAYGKRGTSLKGVLNLENIRKEGIVRERKLQDEWSRRYAHLTSEYFRKVLAEECEKAGLPADTFERKRPENHGKNCPVPLVSPPIPVTTSATVGWRSSRPECNLEFVGRLYISPKSTTEPPPKPGEPQLAHQRFIFLG